MESCVDIDFAHADMMSINNSFVESSFEAGLNFVLSQVEHARAFKKRNSWSASTWCMRTRRNSILKKGTAEDKLRLGPATQFNRPHKEKRSFVKSNKSISKKLKIDRAVTFIDRISGSNNSDKEEHHVQTDVNNTVVCNDTNTFTHHLENDPVILVKNSNGQFTSVPCEICDSNIPTSHRCMFQKNDSNFIFNGVRICGKAFCCICLEVIDSDDNTKCPVHQQICEV